MKIPTIRRRHERRFRPDLDALEGRVVLSGMPVPASRNSAAYLSQLYLDALNRTASRFEVDTIGGWFDRSAAEGNRFLNILFDSREYRTRVITETYLESFGRSPTAAELNQGLASFGANGSSRNALATIYASQAYYANAGGNDAAFVRALYSDILGRGAEPAGEAHWVRVLRSTGSRAAVVQGILFSNESNQVTVRELYGEYLHRQAEPGGLGFWSQQLARGASPEAVARSIVASPEYVGRSLAATQTLAGLAASNPNFSTLVTALQATGLDQVLNGSGTFTVFAPTNAAFAALPPGTLANLLANPDQLAQVLLYHVVPGSESGPEVATSGLFATAGGPSLGASGGLGAAPLTINGANVTGSFRATNGIVHVVDTVLIPPTQTIAQVAASNPNFSTLVTALQATGLDQVLNGPGPFTVFAPTNAAFAALPPGALSTLLANPGQLSQVLLYHVTPGTTSATELARRGRGRTVQGAEVSARLTNGEVFFNNARVVVSNIVTTNGVIHVIDTVLLPPA